MSFVTDNNFQTPMFIPIPDNPLHLANSLKNPLFLLSRTPSPCTAPSTSFSTLQKKSSLKVRLHWTVCNFLMIATQDDIPISNDVKHTVRWSSPISMSRVIPFRESDTVAKTAVIPYIIVFVNCTRPDSIFQISTQTTGISVPWSISQSLTPNEGSQSTTLFELDSHSFPRGKKGSYSVLSFSRPRALLTQSEELQGRMNLMHLHKVIQPKILSLSISMHNTNSFTRQNCPSKVLTNAKTSQHYVFGSAKSINIPKHPQSPLLKRRSTTPDHNRPRKIRKTDGFPSLEHVGSLLDRIMDQPSLSAGHPRASSAELNSSSGADDNSSGDDELSDNESLFGDQELVREVAVRDDVSTRRVCQTPFITKFIN